MSSATPVEKFNAAVNVIKSLPKEGPYQPAPELMLKFYSLFKQATEGPCTRPKPSMWNLREKYKWEAWNTLGQMDREEAMLLYVDELKGLVETMPMSEKVGDFMDVVGPFIELATDDDAANESAASQQTNGYLNGHDSSSESDDTPTLEDGYDENKNISRAAVVSTETTTADPVTATESNGSLAKPRRIVSPASSTRKPDADGAVSDNDSEVYCDSFCDPPPPIANGLLPGGASQCSAHGAHSGLGNRFYTYPSVEVISQGGSGTTALASDTCTMTVPVEDYPQYMSDVQLGGAVQNGAIRTPAARFPRVPMSATGGGFAYPTSGTGGGTVGQQPINPSMNLQTEILQAIRLLQHELHAIAQRLDTFESLATSGSMMVEPRRRFYSSLAPAVLPTDTTFVQMENDQRDGAVNEGSRGGWSVLDAVSRFLTGTSWFHLVLVVLWPFVVQLVFRFWLRRLRRWPWTGRRA